MMSDVSRETPPAPVAAQGVFGVRLKLAEAYARLLASEGELRGLIGPREVPRLWQRHLLNCAVVAEAIPVDATVADIGSGAGLPGLVLAIRRPDLKLSLIEPMARRTDFLREAVDSLGLENVAVVRGRAEDLARSDPRRFDVVTSRAVAPLDRLARWSLPLTDHGGIVLAMKGSSAAAEISAYRSVVRRCGGTPPELLEVGLGILETPVMLIRFGRAKGAHG
jgi:16S rRNA (guanine527-N7)-methyltransferase